MTRSLALVLCCVIAGPVAAHPHEATVLDSLRAQTLVAPARDLPSPGHAVALSLVATLVPLATGVGHLFPIEGDGKPPAFFWAGLALGPVAGFAYGGVGRHALPTLLVRSAAAASAIWAVDRMDHTSGDRRETAVIVGSTCGGIAGILAIVDIVRVGGVVRRQNADTATVRVIGTLAPDGRTPVLVVQLRF